MEQLVPPYRYPLLDGAEVFCCMPRDEFVASLWVGLTDVGSVVA
jgi:hypothetical protein